MLKKSILRGKPSKAHLTVQEMVFEDTNILFDVVTSKDSVIYSVSHKNSNWCCEFSHEDFNEDGCYTSLMLDIEEANATKNDLYDIIQKSR